jgi:hypothetical protein
MTVPAVIGLHRRGWWRLLPYVALLPLYYGLVSIAAWQALIELSRHPFRWHKTERGFARTSRSGLFNGGGPLRDKDKMVAEAVWQEHLRKTSGKRRPRARAKTGSR